MNSDGVAVNSKYTKKPYAYTVSIVQATNATVGSQTANLGQSHRYHSKRISSMRNSSRLTGLLLAFLITIISTISVFAAEYGSTAADRPNWQAPNTIQNMWENYTDWVEYTNEIDDEFINANDGILMADLAGEGFSVSAELFQHMENGNYPTGNCGQQFYSMYTRLLVNYTIIYSGLYYNLTTNVGEPIDIDFWLEYVGEWQTYFTEDGGIPEKCWNRLDT